MSSANIERIAHEIGDLTPAERDQLFELVRQSEPKKKPLTEEEFENLLLEQGKLVARPTRLPTPPWTPIKISGPQLSQTIIEDRQ